MTKEAFELKDEDLEQVNGGVNWPMFGKAVLGEIDPARYPELIAAIAEQNWIRVAIIAIPLVPTDPEIAKCFRKASE